MKLKDLKLSSREILLGIGSMVNRARSLLDKGKDYDELLSYLIKQNYWYAEDSPLPSVKDISKALSIDYSKVGKQIRNIYMDLILGGETEKLPFTFKDVRYVFSLKSMFYEKYMLFEVDELPLVPHVGENIEIPYFKAYLGDNRFYVESIEHRLDERGQEIYFSLRPGTFNPYLHYRIAQGLEEDEISIADFFEMNDYDLKRKMKIGRLARAQNH